MSFLSLDFILYIAIVVGVYFLAPRRYQWMVLLFSSYGFYLFAGWKLVFFLLFTTISTYTTGIILGNLNIICQREIKSKEKQLERKEKKEIKQKYNHKKKVWLIICLIWNFGILLFLKYFPFIIAPINFIFEITGISYEIVNRTWMLPLGISFYTFQSAGYIIDLYRDKFEPERNFLKFALFVSFFPQIIQGPISRFDELAEQLYRGHRFEYTRFKYGIELMVWGYIKKLVISDRLSIITSTIYSDPVTYSGFYIVLVVILGWIELYTDFSGGIDVARGVAQILGIELPQNFRQPFFADSLAEFWRRWHISLNNWWRDYIFYPLTLSKTFTNMGKKCRRFFGDTTGKKMPIMLALLIIRVLNSIWHGAYLNYFWGGLYHGILIALSFLLEPQIKAIAKKLKINTECMSWKLFQYARTFFLICIPKIINTANSYDEIFLFFKCLVAKFNPWILFDGSLYNLGVGRRELQATFLFVGIGLIFSIFQEMGYSVREKLDEQNMIFRWGVYVAAICSIVIFGVYGLGYDVANFTYMQF